MFLRTKVLRGRWETVVVLGLVMLIFVASDAAFSRGWFGHDHLTLLRLVVPLSGIALLYSVVFGLRWWRHGFVFHDPRE
jgi:hypothetical protein